MRRTTSVVAVLVLGLFAAGLVFTQVTSAYSGTYTGPLYPGVRINLQQNSTTLTGTFDTNNFSGNIGGFVDVFNIAYIWAWYATTSYGSGLLVGKLSVPSDTQATFDFAGGPSTGGTMGPIVLSGMTRGALTGSTTPISTSTTGTTNFAGTYAADGVVITLTQSSDGILSGTFSAGGISGNMFGFAYTSSLVFVSANWNSPGLSTSGAVDGTLSVSGNQATFNFDRGTTSNGEIVNPIVLNLTRQ